MHFEYLSIFIYILLALVASVATLFASYALGTQRPSAEKLSAFECGFNAFDDARMKFDVRFYLVGILFIIFDLEVSYLFPWATRLSHITAFGFWTMFIFLLILTIGFVYEWKKGALEWE